MKYACDNKAQSRFVGTSHGTSVIGFLCDDCIYNKARFASFGESPQYCCFDKTEICSAKMPDYFFHSRNDKSVVVFSKSRIPFEFPKINSNSMIKFRSELTLALQQLQTDNNLVLCARYGTTDKTKAFFDIENVLFYNIGTKHFNALTRQSITFSAVPCSEITEKRNQWNIPEEYSHYYEYTLLLEPMRMLQEGNLLAEWSNISFCKCTGLTPLASWNSIKDGSPNIKIYDKLDCNNRDLFSLVLEIEKPKQAKFNVMTAIKPLLDGLICAFQNSDFNADELEYFSQKLKCDKGRIQDESLNIFGKQQSKYIQMYRNNVKWNPADDLCRYVAISVKDGIQWRLSGKIWRIL